MERRKHNRILSLAFFGFGLGAVIPAGYMPAAIVASLLISIPVAVRAQTTESETEAPIDKIVVVGTQTDLASARAEVELTPGGTDLVDMQKFRTRNVSSLADVLRYVPGVLSSSDSGNDVIFLSSRGSNLDATDYDTNGIKLLQDGLPITTADGNNHNRIVDPLTAQHLTVARGANAVKYGASTLGGAINFVSVTAQGSDAVDVSLQGGSHGQMRTRITVSDVFNERFDALLTVENKEWQGFREHNEQDRTGLYGNAGWRLTDDVVTRFYGTWLHNDQQLPGVLSRAEVGADRNQASAEAVGGNYQFNVDTWRIANKTSWQIDDNRRIDVGFSLEEQSLFHPIADRVLVDFDGAGPAPPTEVFSLLIDTDHRNIGTVLRYNHRIGSHELLFGANYSESSVDGGNYRNLGGKRNGLTVLVENDATLLEAFAMDRWQLGERLMLILAAQTVAASRDVRNVELDPVLLRNPQGDYSSFSPRIGLLYDVRDDFRLYANISRLFEPPTNYELEDNVAGGDSVLDAMEGTVVEVGTRGDRAFGAASSLSWDLSLYYAWIDNEILSVEDPQAPGTSLSTNVEDTVHAGIEMVLRARLALAGDRTIEPVLSVSINEFTFDDDVTYGNNRLPAAPEYVLRGEIIYRDANGFYAGPTLEIVGDRYADFVNSYKIDGYTLAGLRGGWSGERWSLYADVRNILDEHYIANHSVRNIASTDDAILNPGAPLSAYFGVRWQFE